ncbi:MAG: hypothetical protein IPP91_13585 [Betaproteobacteria bacterium]|nr:hypothetical protein [Betaproteobacteria bacterium]
MTPSLAQSWKLIDDLTWGIPARKGVTFHDGSPFTADDVPFTIDVPNVLNSPNSFSCPRAASRRVTKVDDHTVDPHQAPSPQQPPNDLSNVFIVSAKAAKAATTADFNSRKAAIGTGPTGWSNG